MAGSVYEGKTFDEAVRKGLEVLRLSRAEAVITTVEEGKGGFLGFGARPFRVSVARRPGGAIKEPAERGSDDRRGGRRNEREARGGRGGREATPQGRGERAGRAGRDERPARAGRDDRAARGPREERPELAGRDEQDDRAPKAPGRREERGGREERAPREEKVAREERAPRERAPREERRPTPAQAAAPSPVPPAVADGGDDDSPRKRRRRGRRGGRGRRRGGAGEEGGELEAATSPVIMNGVEASEHEEQDTPRSAPVAVPAAAAAAPPMPATPAEPVMARLAPEPELESVGHDAPEAHEHAHDQAEARAGVGTDDEGHGGRPERDPREARRERFRGRHERGGEQRERSEAPDMTSEELIATSKKLTVDLLGAMGFEPRVTVRAEGNRVDVTVEVDRDENLLNGRQGETRQSLQHLLNRFLNKGDGSRYHLQLEVNDFWQQREVELADLARGMADDAITRNAEVSSDYLNSQERRILHVTLKEDTRVRTYSLGTGMLKRVAVAPASFPERSEDDSAS